VAEAERAGAARRADVRRALADLAAVGAAAARQQASAWASMAAALGADRSLTPGMIGQRAP